MAHKEFQTFLITVKKKRLVNISARVLFFLLRIQIRRQICGPLIRQGPIKQSNRATQDKQKQNSKINPGITTGKEIYQNIFG